ncbi:hypothetical protein PGSY75_0005700B, partial [Plasmodium gaboni]
LNSDNEENIHYINFKGAHRNNHHIINNNNNNNNNSDYHNNNNSDYHNKDVESTQSSSISNMSDNYDCNYCSSTIIDYNDEMNNSLLNYSSFSYKRNNKFYKDNYKNNISINNIPINVEVIKCLYKSILNNCLHYIVRIRCIYSLCFIHNKYIYTQKIIQNLFLEYINTYYDNNLNQKKFLHAFYIALSLLRNKKNTTPKIIIFLLLKKCKNFVLSLNINDIYYFNHNLKNSYSIIQAPQKKISINKCDDIQLFNGICNMHAQDLHLDSSAPLNCIKIINKKEDNKDDEEKEPFDNSKKYFHDKSYYNNDNNKNNTIDEQYEPTCDIKTNDDIIKNIIRITGGKGLNKQTKNEDNNNNNNNYYYYKDNSTYNHNIYFHNSNNVLNKEKQNDVLNDNIEYLYDKKEIIKK